MKRNIWKRMLPLMVMLVTVLSVSAAAADLSGSCGEGVTWVYDAATATLTISGSGSMDDYAGDPENAMEWELIQPWYEVRQEIRAAVVEEGVTYVGGSAFSNCTALESVSLPQSLTMMWGGVFEYCSALKEITLPKNLAGMDDSCFLACTALERITVEEGNTVYWDEDGVLFQYDTLDSYGTRICCYPAGKEGTSYTIPEGVTDTYCLTFAFSKLEEIIYPESFRRMGVYEVSFCENMRAMRFLGAAPEIRSDTFVYAPEGLTIYAEGSEPGWGDDEAYDAAASTWHGIPIVFEGEVHVHNWTFAGYDGWNHWERCMGCGMEKEPESHEWEVNETEHRCRCGCWDIHSFGE